MLPIGAKWQLAPVCVFFVVDQHYHHRRQDRRITSGAPENSSLQPGHFFSEDIGKRGEKYCQLAQRGSSRLSFVMFVVDQTCHKRCQDQCSTSGTLGTPPYSFVIILVSGFAKGKGNIANWRNGAACTCPLSFSSWINNFTISARTVAVLYPRRSGQLLPVAWSDFERKGWLELRQEMHCCIKNGRTAHLRLRSSFIAFLT
jgi:hypothetical protein